MTATVSVSDYTRDFTDSTFNPMVGVPMFVSTVNPKTYKERSYPNSVYYSGGAKCSINYCVEGTLRFDVTLNTNGEGKGRESYAIRLTLNDCNVKAAKQTLENGTTNAFAKLQIDDVSTYQSIFDDNYNSFDINIPNYWCDDPSAGDKKKMKAPELFDISKTIIPPEALKKGDKVHLIARMDGLMTYMDVATQTKRGRITMTVVAAQKVDAFQSSEAMQKACEIPARAQVKPAKSRGGGSSSKREASPAPKPKSKSKKPKKETEVEEFARSAAATQQEEEDAVDEETEE